MTKKCSGAQLGGELRHTSGNEAHDKITFNLTLVSKRLLLIIQICLLITQS